MYIVEFQKPGLPHCNLLFWLHPDHKLREPSQIDRFISTEIPNPQKNPIAYHIVTEFMIHGPCGYAKTSAPCMKTRFAPKNFPNNSEKRPP